MKIQVTYIPCLFDDAIWLRFESHNQTPISIIYSLIQRYPEVRKDSGNLSIRVNGIKLHFSKWRNKLKDGDKIVIIQEIGDFITWTFVGITFGEVMYGISVPTAIFGVSISTIATIATIAYAIYSYATAPSPPETGKGMNSSPTYGWDGIQMQSRQGIPVPIVYGEHLVGGNLIECYISSDDDKSYLNMLIALSEGEISGIMKKDLSGVCTALTDIPYILINDNPIDNFTGVTWDYRLGTQDQAHIDGFGHICQTYSTGAVKLDYLYYLATVAVNNGGSGYSMNDVLTIVQAGASGGTATVTGVTGDVVNAVTLGATGAGYIDANGLATTVIPSGGVGCTLNITTPAKYIYTTIDSDVEGFEVRFRVPQLYQQYEGNYYAWSITAKIEYKLHTDSVYIDAGDCVIWKLSFDAVRRSFRVDNLVAGQYDIRVTKTSGDSNPPYYFGDLYLDNIIEIKYDTLTYPHTALLALKLLATEQLSGGLPNVLTRMRGIKVLNLNTEATEWTRNPIYNINNLMVTPRYGLGRYIAQSNINHDQLVLMAAHCDEMIGDGTRRGIDHITATSVQDHDYTFVAGDVGKYICCTHPTDSTIYTNLIITSVSGDTATGSGGWTLGTPSGTGYWEFGEKRYELDLVIDSLNDAFPCINQICGSFRGTPMWNRDAIQLLIDKKESPSYIFNMGNILEGSFKHMFASQKSKPNSIEIDYADKMKRFQKETIEITDYTTITGVNPKRTRRMSLIGASRQSQNYREARFHLNAAKLQDEQINFKGGIDGIYILPGEVDKFQHDVFSWGYGGRVLSSSGVYIGIDQTVTIDASKSYVLTCKLADDTLETKALGDPHNLYAVITVTISAGGSGYSVNDILTITGGTATVTVTSVAGGVVDGVTVLVNGVGYDDLTDLATTVVPSGGTGCKLNITIMTTSTIIVASAYTTDPPIFGLYAFGETNAETKSFRIMQIMKTPENEIEVSATEYSASVYADTNIVVATPLTSPLPPDPEWPSPPDTGHPDRKQEYSGSVAIKDMTAVTGWREFTVTHNLNRKVSVQLSCDGAVTKSDNDKSLVLKSNGTNNFVIRLSSNYKSSGNVYWDYS